MDDTRLDFKEAIVAQLTDYLMVARLDETGTVISGGFYSVSDLLAVLNDINDISATEVEDILTSTNTDKALSANQGRVLKVALDLKAAANAITNIDNTSDANKPISSAQATINNLKADKATTIISVTASKALALTDASTLQKCNSSSAITITIPTNSTVAFPIGTEIAITQYGTGSVTFASTSTINSSDSLKSINGQYQAVTLKKMNTDEWLLIGALI